MTLPSETWGGSISTDGETAPPTSTSGSSPVPSGCWRPATRCSHCGRTCCPMPDEELRAAERIGVLLEKEPSSSCTRRVTRRRPS